MTEFCPKHLRETHSSSGIIDLINVLIYLLTQDTKHSCLYHLPKLLMRDKCYLLNESEQFDILFCVIFSISYMG